MHPRAGSRGTCIALHPVNVVAAPRDRAPKNSQHKRVTATVRAMSWQCVVGAFFARTTQVINLVGAATPADGGLMAATI